MGPKSPALLGLRHILSLSSFKSKWHWFFRHLGIVLVLKFSRTFIFPVTPPTVVPTPVFTLEKFLYPVKESVGSVVVKVKRHEDTGRQQDIGTVMSLSFCSIIVVECD